MSLFTSDLELIERIAVELSACGCCARCTLRYLGLKDMQLYKGDLQHMEDKVKELQKRVQKDKTVNDNTVDLGVNEQMDDAESDEMKRNDSEVPNSLNGTETPSQSNTSNTEIKLENEDTNKSDILESRGTNKIETEESNVKIGTEKDVIETTSNNGEVGTETEKTDVKLETDNIESGKACGDVKGKETESRQPEITLAKYILNGDKDTKVPPCVVCLGVLQNFCSEKYLNKLKEFIVNEGFHFSTYMCSLMVPVNILVREHAMMLHLKEKFSSVYSTKRDTDVAQTKDVWKWRCGPLLTSILGSPFDVKSKFEITMTFQYDHANKECSFLLDAEDNDAFRKRKQDRRYNRKKTKFALYTRANVAKALEQMSKDEFKRSYQCPPLVPRCYTQCDVKCQNENIFVAGRYNKFSRVLSQTPWIIDGISKTESSVEELLEEEIKAKFHPSEIKFSSSGREDVDVLMLGNGRPFVLELVNPKRREFTQQEMNDIQKVTNLNTKDIRCSDLQIVTKEETDILKEGEIDKVKKYRATCWSKLPVTDEQLNSLSSIVDLKLLQKTPIRVLHRRPLSTRARMIHNITAERINDNHFKLDLSTQAGTYVKEFVHGDFGRTKPNVSTLLSQECDILELDVTAVELDWPNKTLTADAN